MHLSGYGIDDKITRYTTSWGWFKKLNSGADYFSHTIPEKRLLYQILFQAIVDYLEPESYLGRCWAEDKQASAKKWLFDNGNQPFSFLWICDHLEVRPDIILDNIKTEGFKLRLHALKHVPR